MSTPLIITMTKSINNLMKYLGKLSIKYDARRLEK